MYPQIDNNILLFPELTQYDTSRPTAFSVNWTVVNAISWVFNAPYNLEQTKPILVYNGSNIQEYYPPVWYIRFWNNTFRISSPEPLSSWMTIWKTIIIPRMYGCYKYNSWSKYNLEIKVWILHSDWTITYIADDTKSYTQSYVGLDWINVNPKRLQLNYNAAYWNYLFTFWKTVKINTNWYITQEWDYIIVEYNTLWESAYEFLSFWTQTPTRESEMIYPIQVSID